MIVLLNGEARELDGVVSVADLLAGKEIRGTAVAVNGVVVPRHGHHEHRLRDGDRIDWVTAVQGG